MPNQSAIERRNRALTACTLLTDAREVKTKFSKTFTTYFFPVGDAIQQNVHDWMLYLKQELLRGNDDPLFPKTNIIVGDDRIFKAMGLKQEHWSNASPIRTIFREAFESADLPYFNPHSFRKTLVTLGQQLCQTPEEFKSWSQNLGHEDVLTTLYSYGEVQQHQQGEIIQQLKQPRAKGNQNMDEIARAFVRAMAEQQINQSAVKN